MTHDANKQQDHHQSNTSDTDDVARDEQSPDLSERILDKEGAEKKPVEQKAQEQVEKLKTESEQNTHRSDNQETSDRILDKEEDSENS